MAEVEDLTAAFAAKNLEPRQVYSTNNALRQIVELLMNDGLNGDGDDAPLAVAAKAGETEIVRRLLKTPGIDIDKTDGIGRTALNLAVGELNDEIVDILLQAGANPNGGRRQGCLQQIAYMSSARGLSSDGVAYKKIVRSLIAAGANTSVFRENALNELWRGLDQRQAPDWLKEIEQMIAAKMDQENAELRTEALQKIEALPVKPVPQP